VNLDEYYKRLNLSRSASPSDVKRAYRRLRAKYHPDRNKGRESTVAPVFTRIQEAFEILTGKRAPPASPPPPPASTERPSQPARSADHHGAPAMRGANCLIELFVPLEAAIHGGEVRTSYPVKEPCHACQDSAVACTVCQGTRSRMTVKSAAVKIAPGAWDGQRLVIEGGGHPGTNGGPAGDAICSVAIVCDAAFRRDGLNLACEIQVDFVTATLGGSFEANILGHAHLLQIPPNAQAGSKIRLAEQGLAERNGSRGDLTLQLVLAMPAAAAHLSGEERKRLRDMFAEAELRSRRLVGSSR